MNDMVDHIADMLNTLKTHETLGQRECTVKATKLTRSILEIFKTHGYLKDYDFLDDQRGGKFGVHLDGRINNCGVIKPRFPVKKNEWYVAEQKYIPGVGVGLLIVSTNAGIMTNSDAEKKQIGGRLLAYIY